MGRNVITKKALTLEQFTGLVKEKYLELGLILSILLYTFFSRMFDLCCLL